MAGGMLQWLRKREGMMTTPFAEAGAFTPYAAIGNITGQPAIVLPTARRDDGLPIGVHLIGRPAQEGPLLALAAQVEAALPWAERRPEV